MDTAATATATVVFLSALVLVPALDGVTPAVEPTRASCTEEQVQKCRQAAEDDTLGSLEGGGKCNTQRYVHYTHACTVSDYRPHIDFCCCAASVKVLCCRYQQSWDRFRCSEAEDTIHTLCDKRTEKGESVCAPKRPPLYILLPCVLGPLLILGCCIYCCVRHCRYCHNDDDEDIKWGCSCWSPEKKKHSGMSDPSRGFQFQNSHSESEPLNSLPAALLVDGGKRPLDSILDGARTMPTAPALDDSADEAFTSGHCHHHHPHHRMHHHYGGGHHQPHQPHQPQHKPHSLTHQSDLPGTGTYTDATLPAGYGRQSNVVSAPGGLYTRAETSGGNMVTPCSGGCGGYMRQESAPCGPVAPSYTQHHMLPLPLSELPLPEAAEEGAVTGVGAAGAVGPPPPAVLPAGPNRQQQAHFGLAGVHVNVRPQPGGCPSCATSVCAPPTYDESLQHQVLHQ